LIVNVVKLLYNLVLIVTIYGQYQTQSFKALFFVTCTNIKEN